VPTSTQGAAAALRRPLIIGYGNSLRSDDGIGWHVANALRDDPRTAGIDVIASHQLTPELAEDLHRASLVVLVDARVDGSPPPLPGHCEVSRVSAPAKAAAGAPAEPGTGARTEPGAGGASTHHCTPRYLATLAEQLYGRVAPLKLVGVGVASIDDGDQLTPAVAAAVPSIVDLVLDLIGDAKPAPSFPEDHRHA